jgi:ABC-type Na+ efflux pump permease subunit
MQQLLTFAWKQVHRVYSDRGLLVFMLLTPLAIATIMGLAFGGQSGTIVIRDIPLAVVNLDEGSGDSQFGATVARILLSQPIEGSSEGGTCSLVTSASKPSPPQSLDDLLAATALTDVDAARAGVEDGTYVAALIIPTNFSAALSPEINFASIGEDAAALGIESVSLEIYASAGSPVLARIVRSVTEAVVNQTVRGSIAINATISSLLANPINIPRLSFANEAAFSDFACAFSPELESIHLERLPLNKTQEQSPFVQILVQMGAAQAVFFAIFTMNNSLLSIYNDKKTWILQRLLVTPNPRSTIIFGKILGAMLLVLLQVGLLLLALTVVGSLVMGQAIFIWGNNILMLLLLTLVVAFAVGGLGTFVIGIANSLQQANIFGSLSAIAMAMLGGSFGFSLGGAEKLSIIYWGRSAYSALSAGNNDIGLNLVVLLVVGGILFVIGAWLFNKRVEV